MMQLHSIVLWKKAENREFDEIAKEAYKSLENLQYFPSCLRPNYLTSDRKTDVKEFSFDYQHFKKVLKENMIGSTDNLGYAVSFFSSMDELQSCSIRMKVGIKNKQFSNSLVMSLPCTMDLGEKQNFEMITDLFKHLVRDFQPFWGAVVNKNLAKRYDRFLQDGFPVAIFGMNYWGEDIVTEIDEKKIKEFVNSNPSATYYNGILSLKDGPIDIYNELDMSLQHSAEEILL